MRLKPLTFVFAVALVGLGVGLGCQNAPVTGVRLDSELRAFVPRDTKALFSVAFDKVKESGFFKRHRQQLEVPQLTTMSERAGLDPRRDLSTLLIAWDGKQALVMAHGTFKRDVVEQKLSAMTATRSHYKKFTLFGDGNDAVTFLPKGIALAGTTASLRAAIDHQASGGGTVPDALQQRMESVSQGSQVWEVSDGVLPLTNLPLRSDVESALSNIVDYVNGTTMGLRFGEGADVQLDISCVSQEGAQRVRDALKGSIGLARLTTRDNELDLLRLWDAIHVEQDSQVIHIRADLPADLADKLINYLPSATNRAGRLLDRSAQ